jgi:hypothetical protein
LRKDICICPEPQPRFFRKGTQDLPLHIKELKFKKYVLEHDKIINYEDTDDVIALLAS